ncbi:hypothetical protein FZEAL_8511 [Fusarium zealandicum]|uniref:NmrA-like domain-containing protein n=1 Tax=Fusarium zealandicum TaxID=1053134 RepID=A0A8H4UDM9_9HYPO|nr:hypothetical protein FZEAL_8511 [Fusarium zealandicum]
MTIAGFFAVACYNSIEILISLLNRFKRHDGLYFWSMLTATLGIVLHSLVVLLRYYSLGPNFLLSVLTCIGWYGMVTGQSVVLYSRLHLIVSDKTKTRWVLVMIITNFFILHVPVTVLFLGSNTKDSARFLLAFNIYERIQLAGFFLQESIISGLYIWETARGLKPIFAFKRAIERKVIRHLIIVNILVILLDITLLLTQYLSHFQIQTTYKPVVYSIKLKMEFIVLNKLLLVVKHGECSCMHAMSEPGAAAPRPSYIDSFDNRPFGQLPPSRESNDAIRLDHVSRTTTNASTRTDSRGPQTRRFSLFNLPDPYYTSLKGARDDWTTLAFAGSYTNDARQRWHQLRAILTQTTRICARFGQRSTRTPNKEASQENQEMKHLGWPPYLQETRVMSKILAVFGATGQQGSSVIDFVLNDTELSQQFELRAITRDVDSDKARQLKEKVQVVQGDVLNRASLSTALTGVHTVFAMTTPSFGPDALDIEYNNGKAIADVAVGQGVEYIIFSTLPAVRQMSDGRYTKVTPFDAKAKVEQYIRGLPLKSAFYCPGSFMENFQAQSFLAPRKASDGTWVLSRPSSPTAQLPLLSAVSDTGKFIGAILADPDKYQGKTFHGATALYTWEEVAAILSEATGKTIVYKEVPDDDFKKGLAFEPEMFSETFRFYEEFKYFGTDAEDMIAWAVKNARGRVSSFEEFLEAHPFQLE